MKNTNVKSKAQASGRLKRILNFEFIVCLIYMEKKIMCKIRIAAEKLEEEEEINIIDAIKMLEVMKKLFERISEDEMNNFIESAKGFATMRGIDPEASLVRSHHW